MDDQIMWALNNRCLDSIKIYFVEGIVNLEILCSLLVHRVNTVQGDFLSFAW